MPARFAIVLADSSKLLKQFVRPCMTLLFALVLILPASNALAQKTTNRFEDLSAILKPGDRVIVVMTDGTTIKGRTADVNAASIVITDEKSQQPRTIPSMEVERISTRDPVANGIKIGAGIGAVAGLVGGLLENAICSNEGGSCLGAVIGLAAIGAAGGAAAGWGLDSAHGSRVVYERSGVRVKRETATDFFGSVDYSHTAQRVFSPQTSFSPQQISLSAGIGRHYLSGFGIEGEIQRTVHSDLKLNPCVAPIFGAQAGTCGGSAMEGVESQLVGTGRMVYSMRSRFQPFISGGFSFLQTVEQHAFAESFSGVLQVHQFRPRFNQTAAPVGGGFRVALNPSISIRPAVTYYIGAERTTVSVGVVYRRK